MRVLFVYKFLTVGGVETVLATRLAGLSQWGIQARAWFLHPGPGAQVLRGLEDRYQVGPLEALEQALDEEALDLVTTIDTEEVFPLFRRRPALPPLVLEVHSPYEEGLTYLRHLARAPLRAIFVPSVHQQQVMQSRVQPPAPVVVVPNPLAPAFLRPASALPSARGGPLIAWVGRLDAGKNWPAFLELAAALVEERDGLQLWLAGSSPQPEEELELWRKARALGLAGRLRWFRNLPHGAVARLLDALRERGGVFVSTSRAESFGMTVAEAMARGCAVLAPEYGPFPEFIRHGENGLLYPPKVEAAIAPARRLLGDGRLRRRLGEQARVDILTTHAPQVALAELARAMRRVLEPTGRA